MSWSGCTVAVDVYCWLHRAAFGCAEQLVQGRPTDAYIKYVMKVKRSLHRTRIRQEDYAFLLSLECAPSPPPPPAYAVIMGISLPSLQVGYVLTRKPGGAWGRIQGLQKRIGLFFLFAFYSPQGYEE